MIMLNQTIIVGRLVQDPENIEQKDDRKESVITLAVQRSYKNEDGTYDTDFIPVTLWNGIATNTAEYCHKGDVIGVKGRLQTKNYENEDGTFSSRIEVVADRVTFLSSRKEHDEGAEE